MRAPPFSPVRLSTRRWCAMPLVLIVATLLTSAAGEAERRPTLLQMISDGEIEDGIAICDHAAPHYIDGKLHQVVTASPAAKAFYVSRKNGEAHEEEIPTHLLEG